MPALKNQRHEKFAVALFEGKSATDAYAEAGYKPCRKNAARLTTKDDIRRRLAELQAPVAAKAAINVDSLNAEIDAALAVAADRGQAAAMVAATSLRAKIAGLLVQRVEVGDPGDFSQVQTYAELADEMLAESELRFHPVTDADRQGLTALLEQQANALGEYLAAINARPVNGQPVNPIDVRAREMAAQRRPSRLINGR